MRENRRQQQKSRQENWRFSLVPLTNQSATIWIRFNFHMWCAERSQWPFITIKNPDDILHLFLYSSGNGSMIPTYRLTFDKKQIDKESELGVWTGPQPENWISKNKSNQNSPQKQYIRVEKRIKKSFEEGNIRSPTHCIEMRLSYRYSYLLSYIVNI